MLLPLPPLAFHQRSSLLAHVVYSLSRAPLLSLLRTLVRAVSGLLLAGSAALVAAQSADYDTVSRMVRAGQFEQAQARADQYLSGNPKDPQMRFLKGVIQQQRGQTDEALATFTLLSQDYPELPEPYNNLAVIHAAQNQFDKARVALEMAVRTNPSYATAHENLGDVYARLAAQSYGRALQLDGGNNTAAPKLKAVNALLTPPAKKPAR